MRSPAIRGVCGDTGGEHAGVVPCVANENSVWTGEKRGCTGVEGACGANVERAGEKGSGAMDSGRGENVGCTGENAVWTGENGACTGAAVAGCTEGNRACTGENVGEGCGNADSGCEVNTNCDCTGGNAVFTSSWEAAALCGEYGTNGVRCGEYGGRLDVRGEPRMSAGNAALLGVVASATCSVGGGNRGSGAFSSPRYIGGGATACCGTSKVVSVGALGGGAAELKLAVDLLVLRLMAS